MIRYDSSLRFTQIFYSFKVLQMQEFYKVPDQETRKVALGSLPGLPYRVKKALEEVLPLSIPMSKPKPGEWLYEHEQEGQTFDAYKGQMHNQVDEKRKVIYIKPLQQMSMDFLKTLQQYCECFFYPLKVTILKTDSLQNIPHRINDYSNRLQYHAGSILKSIQKKLPVDAFCMIGVSLTDLYPRDQWNFVFGLASIKNRTGVFSFARYDQRFYGDDKYEVDYNRILWRSISVMVHEITHMFGVRHCIYYQCVMNGSNHLEESDSRPLELCCVCLRKLQSNIKFDILERFKKLLEFVEKRGDKSEKKIKQFLTTVIFKIESKIKQ